MATVLSGTSIETLLQESELGTAQAYSSGQLRNLAYFRNSYQRVNDSMCSNTLTLLCCTHLLKRISPGLPSPGNEKRLYIGQDGGKQATVTGTYSAWCAGKCLASSSQNKFKSSNLQHLPFPWCNYSCLGQLQATSIASLNTKLGRHTHHGL